MNLFYSPDIDGDQFLLGEQESKHAVRVLRLGRGDAVQLVDGKGGWYEAVIEEDDPRKCRLRITSFTPGYRALPYRLHLAVSPTKSMERFEWFLEKATEIGISEISPLLCHRTERRSVKPERLEKISISAMKQSLKAYKPVLHPATSFESFVTQQRLGILGIAHCKETDRRGIAELGRSTDYTLLIGPEGDFTGQEVQQALESGYTPIHLGESRLRTETAAVYACTAVSLVMENDTQ